MKPKMTDEEKKAKQKAYYQKNKEKITERSKRNYEQNREKRLEYIKQWYQDNKEERLEYTKQYQQEHRDERKAYLEKYNVDRKDVIAANYEKKKNDPVYKERRRKHNQTPDGKYVGYKSSAKSRGVSFNLTKEQFSTFWAQPCSYCGSEIETIGLDRIDSSIGYTVENIVTCCKTCNYIKARHSMRYMTDHVIKIVLFNQNPFTMIHESYSKRHAGYRNDAGRRGIEFELSKDTFKQITSGSCVYCGSIKNIGIDRVNNNIGYVERNVVPCCSVCNLMKHTHTKEHFLNHIHKIYNHLKLGDAV